MAWVVGSGPISVSTVASHITTSPAPRGFSRSPNEWTRIEAPPIPSLSDLGIEAIEPPGEEGEGEVIDSWEWTDEVIAPNEDLWATSGYYGAVRYDGKEWRHYSTADGLASDQLTFVAIGPDGSVWLGSEDAGLSRVLPDY